MLSPRLDSLGVRPVQAADAAELHGLIEANRAYLAPWLPWAAGQDLARRRGSSPMPKRS